MVPWSLVIFCSSAVAAIRRELTRSLLRRCAGADADAAVWRVVLPVLLLGWRINFLEFFDIDDGGAGFGRGIFLTDDVARFGAFLLAKGKDLCSPWGCLFLVGDSVAGGGSPSRLPALPGSGSASFPSGCLALSGLEGSASFSPPGGSPMFVLRLKSVLVGAPGWWLLRLHQVLRSSGGGDEAPGFRSARASRLGGLSVSASRPG